MEFRISSQLKAGLQTKTLHRLTGFSELALSNKPGYKSC